MRTPCPPLTAEAAPCVMTRQTRRSRCPCLSYFRTYCRKMSSFRPVRTPRAALESAPGAGRPSQIPRAGPGRLGRGQGRLWVARGGGVARARERPEKCLELSKTRRIWCFSGRALFRRPTRESLFSCLTPILNWCQVRGRDDCPESYSKNFLGGVILTLNFGTSALVSTTKY